FCFYFFLYSFSSVIYTLSLHDALPIFLFIFPLIRISCNSWLTSRVTIPSNGILLHLSRYYSIKITSRAYILYKHKNRWGYSSEIDRKSTRLNSSHVSISYAVFCLKKKK